MKRSHITIITVAFVFVMLFITAQNAMACDNFLIVNEGTPYEEQFHLCDKLVNTNLYECEITEDTRIYSNCKECKALMTNSVTDVCENCENDAKMLIETKEKIKDLFPWGIGLFIILVAVFVFAAIRFKNEKKADNYYDINRKDLAYILGSPMTVMIVVASALPFLLTPLLLYLTI